VTDVRTADGRTLHVHEAGDPSGAVVLAHHGTPSTGVLYERWSEDAAARGIRLLGYDRPGYGGSTRHEGRSVADAVADVETILDALDVDRAASWGVSGGGPHVLACAALLPERIGAVASLSSVGPYGVDGLDFFEGMGEGNVEEFGAVLEGPEAHRRALDKQLDGMRDLSAEQLVAAMKPYLSDVDAGLLTDEFGAFMHAGLIDAMRTPDGWFDDNVAFAQPWGFDLGAIEIPVLLLQGVQDEMVPAGHARWLAQQIPHVEARIREEDGHLTYLTDIGPVHEWLSGRL
jgi:pimeloyl-ACP methyl ester carboxylesterase